MKIPFKPYKAEDADIFTVDAIHQKYWKDFCDVCYPHFGFEEKEDGERTYEQKYDTFRRCYIFTKQHFKWNEVLWFKVHDQDFERFKKAYDIFIQLCTEDHASIPMLLVLLRMQQSIWENLKRDGELMEYIYPRKCTINYEKYSVDFLGKFPSDENLVKNTGKLEHEILDALYQERPWDEEWKYILEGADVHHVDEFEGEKIEWDENVGGIVQQLAECILHSYNNSIYEFSSKYYNIVTAKKGSVVRALVFRLFTSYQISLQEVKTIFDDYPEHLCVKKLEQTRESLIAEFKQTKLGTHWCECITSHNGLEKVGKYLINHRDNISEEEEARFFYLLDEICIITDILRGNAAKYWLNVNYNRDNADKHPQEELNLFAPKKNLQELLKKPWFAEVRTDEKYDSTWTDAFVEALMASDYGEGIARDWAVTGARDKKKQLKAYVVGLLKDEGVLKGSYVEIGNKTGLNNKERTFSTNMSRGKKQPYAEWVKEYVAGQL